MYSSEHVWKRVGPRKRILSASDMSGASTSGEPFDLHTWGGSVEVKSAMQGKGYCARPHRHIVVAWDGKVPLCCAVNPARMEVIADINECSLKSAWNSLPMFYYRSKLEDAERVGQCEKCNERMAFPHVVRPVRLTQLDVSTYLNTKE